jgi:hypothetical protein
VVAEDHEVLPESGCLLSVYGYARLQPADSGKCKDGLLGDGLLIVEDYRDVFYPTVSNIDGREQFELLLRGDVGMPAIGRKAILRRMTWCFFAREQCRGCKTLPWLGLGRPRQPALARLE